MRVRVTVWLANAIPVSRPEKGSRAQSGAQLGAQSKESEVTQSLAICRLLEDAPLAEKDLLLLLGLSSKTGAFKRAIKELIEYGSPPAMRL